MDYNEFSSFFLLSQRVVRKVLWPNLGNLRKLVTGEVDESQVAEAQRHRGVALDEGSS